MNEETQSTAPVSSPQPIPSFGNLCLLDLEKIIDSAFVPRIQLDRRAVERIAATIPSQWLHDPVVARPAALDGMYELLSGRLRVEAFRLLRDTAQTPEERQKYSAIPARVMSGMDDKAACRWAITSNAARVANNPLEMSEAVMKYIELTDDEPAAVANSTGLSLTEVQQLVRLAAAPDFIKEACGKGLGDDVPDRFTGEEREVLLRRRLTLRKAMEFLHAFDHLTRHSRELDGRVRQKLKKLVRQALIEDWSVLTVKAEVRALTGSHGARAKGTDRSPRASGEAGGGEAPVPAGDAAPAQAPDGAAGAPVEATPVGVAPDAGQGTHEVVSAGSAAAGHPGELDPEVMGDVDEAMRALLRPGAHPGYTIAGQDLTFHRGRFGSLTAEQRACVGDVLYYVREALASRL